MNDFLSRLLELVQHPGSNLAASAVGLSIVVLSVMMVLVIAIAWVMSASSEDDDDDDGPEDSDGETADEGETAAAERHQDSAEDDADDAAGEEGRPALIAWAASFRGRLWLVCLLSAAGIIGVYAQTSSNEYCGSTCHAMTSPRDSWARSPHRNERCVSCHEGAPDVPLVSAGLQRVRFAAASVMGDAVRGTSVPPQRCLGCHRDVESGTMQTKRGIRVRHQEIIDAGGTCETCHRNVAHVGGRETATAGAMGQCLRCHDGKKASAACSTCHRGDIGRLAVVSRESAPLELPAPSCGGCHSQARCDACHGIRMPHPADFRDPAKHAYLGSFERREVCWRCHTFKEDCSRCHSLPFEMGHNAAWKQVHQTFPVSAGTGCSGGCHRSSREGNLCIDCHPRFAKE